MPRERSTEEFLAAVRRMMRAAARRVAQGDEFELREFRDMLDTEGAYVLGQAVAGQRLFGAKSWAQIGEGAGIRKSAAQERWGGVDYDLWEIEWFDLDESALDAESAPAAVAGALGPVELLGSRWGAGRQLQNLHVQPVVLFA